MSAIKAAAHRTPSAEWDIPFDAETELEGVPRETPTSCIHVSVSPTPAGGSVILRGRSANGDIRGIRLNGKVYAARLPFADGIIRVQYLGGTKSVQLELESYVVADTGN